VLAAALERGHGGLVHPARTPVRSRTGGPRPGMTYVLHADGVRDLRRARDVLRGLDTSTLYVGIAPIPASLAGGPEAASRRRLLARILALLGLPPGRALDLPRSLPDALFVELTHLGGAGRRAYSRALVPILRARLAVSAREPEPVMRDVPHAGDPGMGRARHGRRRRYRERSGSATVGASMLASLRP
jgi:hypothetical protein